MEIPNWWTKLRNGDTRLLSDDAEGNIFLSPHQRTKITLSFESLTGMTTGWGEAKWIVRKWLRYPLPVPPSHIPAYTEHAGVKKKPRYVHSDWSLFV